MTEYKSTLAFLNTLLEEHDYDQLSKSAFQAAKYKLGLSDKEKQNLRTIGAHAYDILQEIEILSDQINVDWYLS